MLGSFFPDYLWHLVTDEEIFHQIWHPFHLPTAHIAEIRRREDRIRLETLHARPTLTRGRSQVAADGQHDTDVYFVHPFIPTPTTLGRLTRAMLLGKSSVMLHLNLTPTYLDASEEESLLAEIALCEQVINAGRDSTRTLPTRTIYDMRAVSVCEELLNQLHRLLDAPFLLQVILASADPLPQTLQEIVGVEITGPVGMMTGTEGSASIRVTSQRGGYDIIAPTNSDERTVLTRNLLWLDDAPWGCSEAPCALQRLRAMMDATQAACAFRLPLATVDGLPGLTVHATRMLPLPREIALLASEGSCHRALAFGENPCLGFSQDVWLGERDRLQHMYVVGKTGTGKSTLLKSMALADMEAGHGVAVIDPHGDLFDELLTMIPPHRLEDVVLLDPTDTDYPVGVNMLESRTGEDRHFVVRQMQAMMRRLLEDQYHARASDYAGPAFYQHMQMNMLLAMSNSGDPGTLLEFYEIFQHKDYWKRWLPLQWGDSQLHRWVTVNLPNIEYPRRYQDMTWGEYLSSRFEDFVFDPVLRLIFGQKHSSINFRTIMDERKILLVNLAKGEIAEANARFLGMILMAKLQAAAMERAALPVEQRHTFYLYVDEFQALATQNFNILLSEARKFGLALILANQFVRQVKDEQIADAIFGNVGTIVTFRVGHQDAEILARHLAPYQDQLDLMNLPNWHACVKATVGGQPVQPFTLRTRLPHQTPDASIAHRARLHSRIRYSRSRADVEAEIARSLEKHQDEDPRNLSTI
ncbi:MAG: AAA-like domain protein [bacterium ADurb.Bin429]|nr:MAG: AAA-like domain protein [bacterium ADurb.Bin429]